MDSRTKRKRGNSKKMKRRTSCSVASRSTTAPVITAAGIVLVLATTGSIHNCTGNSGSNKPLSLTFAAAAQDATNLHQIPSPLSSLTTSTTSTKSENRAERGLQLKGQNKIIRKRAYGRANAELPGNDHSNKEIRSLNRLDARAPQQLLHSQLRRNGKRALTSRLHMLEEEYAANHTNTTTMTNVDRSPATFNFRMFDNALRVGGKSGKSSKPKSGKDNAIAETDIYDYDDDNFHWEDDGQHSNGGSGVAGMIEETSESNQENNDNEGNANVQDNKNSPYDYDDDTFKWQETDSSPSSKHSYPPPPSQSTEDIGWLGSGHPTHKMESKSGKSDKQSKSFKLSGKSGKMPNTKPPVAPTLKPIKQPTLHPSEDPATMPPTDPPVDGLATESPTTPPTDIKETPSPTPAEETPPPTSPAPSKANGNLPSLKWEGVDGCTDTSPCDTCTGDCDSDEDCLTYFECFKRGDGEFTQVPGCAVGGMGDIPGADYCYDPESSSPTEKPTAGSPPPSTDSPTSVSTPTSTPTVPTIITPAPSSTKPLPSLVWKGINGCTLLSPCDICTGDCDRDEDCVTNYQCFKRADGETNQVPGCGVGGFGDIPGADYCYDPGSAIPTLTPIIEGSQSPSLSPLTSPQPTKSPSATSFPTSPPQIAPQTASPTNAPISGTLQPTVSNPPSFFHTAKESSSPTRAQEGFFLRSQSRPETAGKDGKSVPPRHRQLTTFDWCASGALSPDYYQLLLEACTPDSDISSHPAERVEQLDQLWSMDEEGLIHSIFDYSRCMSVQLGVDVSDEASIEISPCNVDNIVNKFYYDETSTPSTLKLIGDEYASFCVTFLGATASKGAPMVMGSCEAGDKFGWDFISERIYGNPTSAPTGPYPPLKYEGRDACNEDKPCGVCYGDCDGNSGCESGLRCFQRGRDETSQVPGCSKGGPGDIPGADYCYDPESPPPPLIWLGKEECTPTIPCDRCTGECADDEGCKGNLKCFTREEGESNAIPGCGSGGDADIPGGNYCYDENDMLPPTPSPTKSPTAFPLLIWRGSDGCTSDDPCPPCTGDCDDDSECKSSLICFQRMAGERTQIPGCAVGGLGDVPGGDYCYDPNNTHSPTGALSSAPTSEIDGVTAAPTNPYYHDNTAKPTMTPSSSGVSSSSFVSSTPTIGKNTMPPSISGSDLNSTLGLGDDDIFPAGENPLPVAEKSLKPPRVSKGATSRGYPNHDASPSKPPKTQKDKHQIIPY